MKFLLVASSPTPQQLFDDVARQLFNHLIDPALVGEAIREKVSLEGESLEQLMREWVTTLLDFARTQRMVLKSFKIDLKIDQKQPYSLTAEVLGELIDPQRHVFSKDPTWLKCKEAQIHKNHQDYSAEILIDE